jgi:hypothetical protein
MKKTLFRLYSLACYTIPFAKNGEHVFFDQPLNAK